MTNIRINDIKVAVKAKVAKIVRDALLDGVEDNLAMVIASEIPEYNPDWCAESDPINKQKQYDDLMEKAINMIAEAQLLSLFQEVDNES